MLHSVSVPCSMCCALRVPRSVRLCVYVCKPVCVCVRAFMPVCVALRICFVCLLKLFHQMNLNVLTMAAACAKRAKRICAAHTLSNMAALRLLLSARVCMGVWVSVCLPPDCSPKSNQFDFVVFL